MVIGFEISWSHKNMAESKALEKKNLPEIQNSITIDILEHGEGSGLQEWRLLLIVAPKFLGQRLYRPMVIHQSANANSSSSQKWNKQWKDSASNSLTFQSPVWRIVPSAHRRTNPQQSGMEWVTLIGSISKGPAVNLLFVLNTLSREGTKIPFSFRRFFISC